nr:hypothetical protein [Bacillus sp. ms-22]
MNIEHSRDDANGINEAFTLKVALIALALGIPYDRINRRGGALCLGHPYSASGAAMMVRLFYEAHGLPKGSYVVSGIGSGGGVGLAVLRCGLSRLMASSVMTCMSK